MLAKGSDKLQLGYIFLGSLLGALVGFIFCIFLLLLNNYKYIWVGPYSSYFFVLPIAYAILKLEVFNIKLIVGRTSAYILTLIALIVITTGLIYAVPAVFPIHIRNIITYIIIVFCIIVAGEYFLKLRLFLQSTAEKKFIKGWYDFDKVVTQISEKLIPVYTVEDALRVIKSKFQEIEFEGVNIFLVEKTVNEDRTPLPMKYYLFEEKGGNSEELLVDHPLIQYFSNNREIILFSNLGPELKLSIKDYRFIKALLYIPLYSSDMLEAIIVLEKKASEATFDDKDFALSKMIKNQTLHVFDRIRPYEDVKREFIETQRKLLETEKMLSRSARLASLGTLTAGVTHEIRNPLGVIRLGINKLSLESRDIDYLKNFRDKYIKHVDRIATIIDKMLYLSKAKEIKKVEINLNKLIEDHVLGLISFENIKIVKQLNTIPNIFGVMDDLHQVLINLTDNAVKAMPKEGTLTYKTYSVLENDGEKVVIEITSSF
jgi:signal transduction histidine kinase